MEIIKLADSGRYKKKYIVFLNDLNTTTMKMIDWLVFSANFENEQWNCNIVYKFDL